MENGGLPNVGTRFSLGSHRGTIRWTGAIPGSKGDWLGVEWDDASRGKHSGENDGRRYFTCRIPGSGSFIRFTSKLSFGSSFLQALKTRYVTDEMAFAANPRSDGLRHYTRKNLADIDVETPNLGSIIQKSSQLQKLRVVGLRGTPDHDEQDTLVARAIDASLGEERGNIRSTCPNITSLDLSESLIPSWLELSNIAIELTKLDTIQLHFNRFASPLSEMMPLPGAFLKLKELQMDGSLVSWEEILSLSLDLPLLEILQLSSNNIKRLNGADTDRKFMTLKSLNLEGNLLQDWKDVCDSLLACPALERLVLSSNPILIADPIQQKNLNVQHVSIWNNPITSWQEIESLNASFGGLQSISLGGDTCPLALNSLPSEMRLIAIARLIDLQAWNNTAITSDERREAELYYLSLVAKEKLKDAERDRLHPRYSALVHAHGAPVKEANGEETIVNGTLRSKLLTINVHVCEQPPISQPPHLTAARESKSISVLTTTPLRNLQSKLARSFQLKKGSKSVSSIWALLGRSLDASQTVLQQLRSEMRSDDENIPEERIVYQMDNLERSLQGYNFSLGDEIVVVVEK